MAEQKWLLIHIAFYFSKAICSQQPSAEKSNQEMLGVGPPHNVQASVRVFDRLSTLESMVTRMEAAEKKLEKRISSKKAGLPTTIREIRDLENNGGLGWWRALGPALDKFLGYFDDITNLVGQLCSPPLDEIFDTKAVEEILQKESFEDAWKEVYGGYDAFKEKIFQEVIDSKACSYKGFNKLLKAITSMAYSQSLCDIAYSIQIILNSLVILLSNNERDQAEQDEKLLVYRTAFNMLINTPSHSRVFLGDREYMSAINKMLMGLQVKFDEMRLIIIRYKSSYLKKMLTHCEKLAIKHKLDTESIYKHISDFQREEVEFECALGCWELNFVMVFHNLRKMCFRFKQEAAIGLVIAKNLKGLFELTESLIKGENTKQMNNREFVELQLSISSSAADLHTLLRETPSNK